MAAIASIQGRNSGDTGFDYALPPINPLSMFTINLAGIQSDGIPQWSYYPHVRDRYLRLLSKREPILSGALYSVNSRFKSIDFEITGGRNVKKQYQDLFAEADGGQGYGQFAGKIDLDLNTQDNGAFVELVGAGKPDTPLVGAVREIWHMDSAQCWRTFDPEFPVIYTNPLDNSYHRMHKSRVIMLSSFTQADERGRNIGYCAVSRVLKMMQIVRAIQTFKEEKVSGKFKRALIYGNGVTPKQFNQATLHSEQTSEGVNFTVLNEIPVLLSMMSDMKLNLLDLASLPDGFNYKEEIDIYVYILAMVLGIDAREIWPGTASGATKADASVQHMKAQGKGIADKINTIETAWNWHIMPSNGTAAFKYNMADDVQDKAEADIKTVKITNLTLMQEAGWIDAKQGYQLAIHEGLIDPDAFSIAVDWPEQAGGLAPMEPALPIPAYVPTTPTLPPQPVPPQPAQGIASKAKDPVTLKAKTEDYRLALQKLQQEFNDLVAKNPADFDAQLTALEKKFAALMPEQLTAAYGTGLAGADSTDDGVARLTKVGQGSYDTFKSSFLTALGAVSVAGLTADEITSALSPFISRIGLYAGSYWQSIWEGQRDATPAATRVRRVCLDDASSCKTCPGHAGEFDSYDDMVSEAGVPGDGNDDCGGNCRCYIEVEDGDGGWGSIVGDPTTFEEPLFDVA